MDTQTLEDRTVDCFTNNPVTVPESLHLDSPATDDDIHWKIMTKKSGHKQVSWRKGNQVMLCAARILWEGFIAEGMEPFKMSKKGKATGKKLTEFDADMEDVVFMPKAALVGG